MESRVGGDCFVLDKRVIKVFMEGVFGDIVCNFALDNEMEGLDFLRIRKFGRIPQFYSVSPLV